jgi:hypothetical protein
LKLRSSIVVVAACPEESATAKRVLRERKKRRGADNIIVGVSYVLFCSLSMGKWLELPLKGFYG